MLQVAVCTVDGSAESYSTYARDPYAYLKARPVYNSYSSSQSGYRGRGVTYWSRDLPSYSRYSKLDFCELKIWLWLGFTERSAVGAISSCHNSMNN